MKLQQAFKVTSISPPVFEEADFFAIKRGDIFVLEEASLDRDIFISFADTEVREGQPGVQAMRVTKAQFEQLTVHPDDPQLYGMMIEGEAGRVFINLQILAKWEQDGVSKWSRTFATPLRKIDNKAAKFGSTDVYYQFAIINDEGETEGLLLTEHELARLRERASQNPEDL